MGNYQIDRERWAQLTIFEQMGNIASEVGRAIKNKRLGKTKRMDGAIDRALDLMDATVEDLLRQESCRVKEVLRARDQFCRLFFDGTFEEDADALERYFMQYAVAAQNMRHR